MTPDQNGNVFPPAQTIPQPPLAFASGGVVPSGSPMSGAAQPQQMSLADVEAQATQFAASHPQQVARIKQMVAQALQTGSIKSQDLVQMVTLARAAIRNPAIYPQIRAYAISQGLATEQDLPLTFDAGLLFVLLVVAESFTQPQAAGQNPSAGLQMPPAGVQPPQFAAGGEVSASQVGAPVPAIVHEGEYVVPKHVVQAKGTEFFDSLVSKYAAKK